MDMQTRQASSNRRSSRKRSIAARDQLLFDFAGRRRYPEDGLHPLDMRRAVLGWVARQQPAGIGVLVPTRIAKYQADVAAFWVEAGRQQLLRPSRTLAVEIRRDREQCWPDCSRHQELLPRLKELKQERARLEEWIREHEPHLQDSDNLFSEYGSWRYAATANPDYPRCLRRIEETEHALYRGSRFEQIRRARVADLLYLAVPAGTVHADELADGWGLLEIAPDLSVSETRAAESWECPTERRLHLVQNVAMTCRESLLFAHGIRVGADGVLMFTPVPHRRRKPQSR